MIRAEKINFSYHGIDILKNISFELLEGEICAIIGKNGVGKTTLLKILAGLNQPSTGTLIINNKEVKYRDKVYENVSFLRQSDTCNVNLTVFEAVLLAVKGDSFFIKNEESEQVIDILSRLKLRGLENKYLYELSGGQLKMVFIAQALCRKKNILLLDEPISNLDYYNQLFILQNIQRISKKNKLATMITMHDVNMALSFADKVLVLHKCKVYNFGDPKKIITEKMMRDVYGVNIVSYELGNQKYIIPVTVVE